MYWTAHEILIRGCTFIPWTTFIFKLNCNHMLASRHAVKKLTEEFYSNAQTVLNRKKCRAPSDIFEEISYFNCLPEPIFVRNNSHAIWFGAGFYGSRLLLIKFNFIKNVTFYGMKFVWNIGLVDQHFLVRVNSRSAHNNE